MFVLDDGAGVGMGNEDGKADGFFGVLDGVVNGPIGAPRCKENAVLQIKIYDFSNLINTEGDITIYVNGNNNSSTYKIHYKKDGSTDVAFEYDYTGNYKIFDETYLTTKLIYALFMEL